MSIEWMGLNTGLSALQAFQQALNVVQHNVANANTDGYTVQRADLTAVAPATYAPFGGIGRGVSLSRVEQLRDTFLDANIRKETQTAGKWEAQSNIYSQIETVFGEPGTKAFASVMGKFWSSWQNVSNDPTNMSFRSTLQADASTMAASFNQIDSRLKILQTYTNDEIKSNVNTVNSAAREIASLNKQINAVEYQGVPANDLRDQRNLLIDKINKILPVTVTENTNGTANVYVNGEALVMTTRSQEILTVPRAGDAAGLVDLKWKDAGAIITPKDGTIAGLLEMRDTVIPRDISQMNTLASGIISKVNEVHRSGMGLDGSSSITGSKTFTGTLVANGSFQLNGTNINVFAGDDLNTITQRVNAEEATTGVHASVANNKLVFGLTATDGRSIDVTADPDSVMLNLGIVNNFFAGTGAGDIAVDPVIKGDLTKIAASGTGAPGDTTISDAIMNLKDANNIQSDSMTFDGYYNAVIADLGVHTEEATNANTNQGVVLDQLEQMRQSVSGVSVDEELTKMMQYQRGYEAAAKFINIVDGLLDTLIKGIKR